MLTGMMSSIGVGGTIQSGELDLTSGLDVEGAVTFNDSGADVDIEDYAKHTPLYYAAEKGYLKIAELLIVHGATVDRPGGDSPLLRAYRYG